MPSASRDVVTDKPLALVTVLVWLSTEPAVSNDWLCAVTTPVSATVRVTFNDQPPLGSRINRLRVYRALTTATGVTDYFFVQELSIGTTAWVYEPDTDLPGELLPSTLFDGPVDGLEGVTVMNAGMLAAFKGKSLYFCEPYKPHAWPDAYSLKTGADIVALAAFGDSMAVR